MNELTFEKSGIRSYARLLVGKTIVVLASQSSIRKDLVNVNVVVLGIVGVFSLRCSVKCSQ